MAIVNNFWLKDQRKQLAGAVVYQAMGQTRTRKLADTVTNPRTLDQMNQRVKWSNLVALYRANRSWMKYAFETKKQQQTDYNKFMSVNVASSRIYLPKYIAAAGGAVAGAYMYTQGSLPSVQTILSNNILSTNIYLASSSPTIWGGTVAALSRVLIDNNPAIREGDQLSVIVNYQQYNTDTGIPYVLSRTYEMVISLSNNRDVDDYITTSLLEVGNYAGLPSLGIRVGDIIGSVLVVLSRTVGGKTYVSSQSSVPVNNGQLIAQFSSQQALADAIASYGESSMPFLSSVSANIGSVGEPAPQISSIGVVLGGSSSTETRYLPGSRVYLGNLLEDGRISVYFDGNVSHTSATLTITPTIGPDVQINVSAGDSRTMDFDIDEGTSFASEAYLAKISINASGKLFEAAFLVTNADTVGGLE